MTDVLLALVVGWLLVVSAVVAAHLLDPHRPGQILRADSYDWTMANRQPRRGGGLL